MKYVGQFKKIFLLCCLLMPSVLVPLELVGTVATAATRFAVRVMIPVQFRLLYAGFAYLRNRINPAHTINPASQHTINTKTDPIEAQRALSLLQSPQARMLFDQAQAGNTFLRRIINQALSNQNTVTLEQPQVAVVSASTAMESEAFNRFCAQLRETAARVQHELRAQPQPVFQYGISFGQNNHTEIGFSVGSRGADSLSQELRALDREQMQHYIEKNAVSLQERINFAHRWHNDVEFRSQVSQAHQNLAQTLLKSLSVSDNFETIVRQRMLQKEIGQYINPACWQKHWPSISRLLYHADGSFKGLVAGDLKTAAQIFGECIRDLAPNEYSDLIRAQLNSSAVREYSADLLQATATNVSWAQWLKSFFVSSEKLPAIEVRADGFNKDMNAVIDAGVKGNLEAAKKVVDTYNELHAQHSCLLHQQYKDQMQYLYSAFKNRMLNAHDIPYAFEQDPYWKVVQSNLDQLKGTADYAQQRSIVLEKLMTRQAQVKDLLQKNALEHCARSTVEQLYYELLDKPLNTWAHYINEWCAKNPELAHIRYAFFKANGLVKGLIYHNKRLEQIDMPPAITEPRCADALKLFNTLAHVDTSSACVAQQIEKAVGLIKSACESSRVDVYRLYLQQAERIFNNLAQGLNEHSLPLHFMHDPLWVKVVKDLDSIIGSDSYQDTIRTTQNAFAVRYLHVQELLKSMGMTFETAPKTLVDLCYNLAEVAPQSWASHIETRCAREPQYEAVRQHLYHANGLLKGMQYPAQLLELCNTLAASINDLEHAHERILLNQLAWQWSENCAINKAISQALDAIKHACAVSSPHWRQVFMTHAQNVYHAITMPTADQRILSYNTIIERVSQSGLQRYYRAMEIISDAGTRLRSLETKTGAAAGLQRIYQNLVLDNAAQVLRAVSQNDLVKADTLLDQGVQVSATQLPAIVAELKAAGKSVTFANIKDHIMRHKLPYGATTAVTIAAAIDHYTPSAHIPERVIDQNMPEQPAARPAVRSFPDIAALQDAPQDPRIVPQPPSQPPAPGEPPDDRERDPERKIGRYSIRNIVEKAGKNPYLQAMGFSIAELEKIIDKLKNVKNFDNVLNKFLSELMSEGSAHGTWYEMKVASDLMDQGRKIISMGEKVFNGAKTLEFDIITKIGRRIEMCECKFGDWGMKTVEELTRKITKLKFQFKYARDNGAEFVTFFYNKVPGHIKQKLREIGIRFFEQRT